MREMLKIIWSLFTSLSIRQAVVLFVLCCLPVISAAQPLMFGNYSITPSELHWGEDYTWSFTAISLENPTQATTLTLHIEEGGVSKRIDETPYGLADEFLPLPKRVSIPALDRRTSTEVRGEAKAGIGLVGGATFKYCDDSQSLCTAAFQVNYLGEPPNRDINGRYQWSITSSAVMSGSCAAVREREQNVEITQTTNIAAYSFIDDFGHHAMLSAAVSTNTYVFTAQYRTAPAFPGTRTMIVRVEFSDNDNGSGRAYWSYTGDGGDLCQGTYDVQYSKLADLQTPEGMQLQLRVFLEGLLIDESVIASSVTMPEQVRDTVLSKSGALYVLKDDHTLWTIALSGSRRQWVDAAFNVGEVDIHDLIFVERNTSADTLYIVDAFLRAVIAVDLADGSRSVVSGCDVINRCPVNHYQVGNGVPLVQPSDAVLDEAGNRLIITDAYLGALIAVDLTSGNRSVVSGCTVADLCPADEQGIGDGVTMLHPQALDMNSSATRIVVVDDELNALFVVDAITGNRAIASGCSLRDICVIDERGLGPSFESPVAVELDDEADLAYVADGGLDAVIEVDLNSGNRTSLLSPVAVRAPYHLALDEVGGRVLVYSESDGALTAILQSARTATRLTTFTRPEDTASSLPSIPLGLIADVRTDAIALSWRPVAEASSYKVYWNSFANINAGLADQVIADINGNSYVHIGLTRGSLYYYAVSAVNEHGESAMSPAVSVMLPVLTGNDETAPTEPLIVSIHASSTTAIALDWMASVDDRSAAERIVYEVHVAESTATVTSEATKRVMVQGIYSVGVGELETSRTYYVRVAALDEAGNRSLSEMISIRTMESMPIISTQNEVILISGIATSDDQGMLIIDTQDLKVGQIIIGEDQEGVFIRRITGVQDDGDQMLIDTEDAALSDAFAELDLNFGIKFEDVDDEAAMAAAKSAAVRARQQGAPVSPEETMLRQSVPTLRTPAPVQPVVWPYQPSYEGGRQILEMRWPDSGFRLRQSEPLSHSDGAPDSVRDSEGLRSDLSPTELRPPSSYQRIANGDMRVFHPYQEQFKAGARGEFDIYIESLNESCVIEPPRLKGVTHKGRRLEGTQDIAIRAKSASTQSAIAGYRLSWQPPQSYMDNEPYHIHISVESSCSSLSLTVPVYVPDPNFRLSIPPINRHLMYASPGGEVKFNSNLALKFNPELAVRVKLSGHKKAYATVVGDLDLSTLLQAIATKKFEWKSKEREIYSKDFHKLIWVGYVPVLISGTIRFLWGAEAAMTGKVDITQEFNANYRLNYGFTYEEGKGFSPIRSEDSSSEYKVTVMTAAGALVELYIIPQLELSLYKYAAIESRLQPKVYGDAALEGTFSYARSSNFREAASDARYRFTNLEAGLGISGGIRAGLRSIFGSASLSWPRDGSFHELFDKRLPIVSLPQIQLTSGTNNTYMAMVTPGRWVIDENTIQEHVWDVIPSEGAPRITAVAPNSVRVDVTEDIGDREYTLRYSGYSRFGELFLQYEEIPLNNAVQFVDVCDRTWQVRDAITALTGNSDCGEVSRADLESIMTTTMTIAYVGISSLSEGDFSG